MKRHKNALAALFALVALGSLWSQAEDPPVLWAFDGISSNLPGYTGNHNPKLGTENTNGIFMRDQMAYITSKIGFSGALVPPMNQVIVAQSQGGLRALAFAKDVVNTARARKAADPTQPLPEKYLKGIIAIDAPVQGFSPLDQGLACLLSKATNDAAIVSKGLGVLQEVYGVDIPGIVANYGGGGAITTEMMTELMKSPTLMVSTATEKLLAPDVDTNPQIQNSALDMARGSEWYTNTVRALGYYEYFYDYDTDEIILVYHPALVQGLIPSEVKIGYIYGDNNAFNDAVASYLVSEGKVAGNPTAEAHARDAVICARIGLSLASYEAASALDLQAMGLDWQDSWAEFLDLASFWDDTYHGEYHAQALVMRAKSSNASDLRNFILDIDQKVADLLGNSASDFLIPVPDQYDSLIGTGYATLGGSPINPIAKTRQTHTNHASSCYKDEVWGTEGYESVGLYQRRVGESGAVRQYLNYLDGIPTTGTLPLRGDWNTVRP